MSRSRRGSKHAGFEYWGKRPLSPMGIDHKVSQTKNKRIGIQKERAILKRQLLKEPTEPYFDEREITEEEENDDR